MSFYNKNTHCVPIQLVKKSKKEIKLVWHDLFLMSPCCLLIITLFSSRCLQIEWAQRFSLLKCTMKALDNRLCLKAFELLGFLVFKMELIRLGKKCAHTLKHDDLSIKVGYVKVTELMMKKPLWIPYIKKVPGSSALNHSNKQKVVAAWKLEHMALKMQIQMYMAIGKNTHTHIYICNLKTHWSFWLWFTQFVQFCCSI